MSVVSAGAIIGFMIDERESLTSTDVRTHNLGLVLSCLDRAGTASRSEISDATGLVRGAITSLVVELIDAGLVRSSALTSTLGRGGRGAGRPQEKLELDGSSVAILGVQFSLDILLVRLTDLAGRTLVQQEESVHIPFGDPAALADILASCVREVTSRFASMRIVQIVMVIPAPIDAGSQTIPRSVDFGWHDVDLPRMLAERIEVPSLGIRPINDANAAAYAEFDALRDDSRFAGVADMIYMKSDVGIGGGAIVDGKVLTGSNGFAFEPGHVVVVPDGLECECGNRGCLVTVAGPDIVLRRARLTEYAIQHGTPEALDMFTSRVRACDPVALVALTEASRWVRMVLGNAVIMFQPRVVVLGGYLAEIVDELSALPSPALRQLGTEKAPGRAAILPAVHGRHSSLDGALMIARRDLLSAPAPLRAVKS